MKRSSKGDRRLLKRWTWRAPSKSSVVTCTTSCPHDHGTSWAIYGQATGTTLMDEWEMVEPALAGRPGKVRKLKTYELRPGNAHTYNEGVMHSPWREGPARMIRIEGGPIERDERLD